VIEGKKIILRTAETKDVDEVVKLLNNFAEKGECWPGTLYSEVQFRRRFAETGIWEENSGTMFILNKELQIIGQIMFFKPVIYMNCFEIAYQIFKKSDRGKGYMSEALRIFTKYLFETKPVPRIQITCIKGNIGSRKTAEKCGYIFEGLLKQSYFHKGRYHDLELFSMTRENAPSLSSVLKEMKEK